MSKPTKFKLTEEYREKAAIALAIAVNGGKWHVDYTEAQRDFWRNRIDVAMDVSITEHPETTLRARVDELEAENKMSEAENRVMRTALEWVCENQHAHRGNIRGVAYKALKDITIGSTK